MSEDEIGRIKADCEADLAEALPALEAAISALDTLQPSDTSQVRGRMRISIHWVECAIF